MGFGVRALWGIQLHFKAAIALALRKDRTRCLVLGTGEGLLHCSAGAGLAKLWWGRREAGRAGQSRAGRRHRHLQVHDGWSCIVSAVTGHASLLVRTGLAEPQCGSELVEGQCHPVLRARSAPARPPPRPAPGFGAFLKWSFQGRLLSCQQLLGILELGRGFQVPLPTPAGAVTLWAGPLPPASPQAPRPCHLLTDWSSFIFTSDHTPALAAVAAPWTRGPVG